MPPTHPPTLTPTPNPNPHPQPRASPSNPLQAFTALQFILEEQFVSEYRVPTLLAVGLEGAWGLGLCAAALPLLATLRDKSGVPIDDAVQVGLMGRLANAGVGGWGRGKWGRRGGGSTAWTPDAASARRPGRGPASHRHAHSWPAAASRDL